MAQSQMKAASENDLTPAGEETLDFDDDNLRGEKETLIIFTRIFKYIKPKKFECPSLVWLTKAGVTLPSSLRFESACKNLSNGQLNKTFTIVLSCAVRFLHRCTKRNSKKSIAHNETPLHCRLSTNTLSF